MNKGKTNLIFELADYHVNSNDVDAKKLYETLKNIL